MTKRIIVFLFLVLCLNSFAIENTIHLPDQNVRHWKSKVIYGREKINVDANLRKLKNKDFFKHEYNKSCTFDYDWIKNEGYIEKGKYILENGAMKIEGKDGFAFGFGASPKDKDPNKSAIGFGRNWGDSFKDNFLMTIDLTQNQKQSTWTFEAYDIYAKTLIKRNFVLVGNGIKQVDLGWLRLFLCSIQVKGIRLTCNTKNIEATIKSLSFQPFTVVAHWKKTFNLDENVIFAHASYQNFESYKLLINGKKVAEGTNVYPTPIIENIDITKFLKKGENTIEMINEAKGWARLRAEFQFEGVAFGKSGKLIPILSDKTWQYSLDGKNYKAPFETLNISYLGDYNVKNNGMVPLYMGLLQVNSIYGKYPLFEYDKPIKWQLKIPVGVKEIPTLSNGKIEKVKSDENWNYYEATIKLKVGAHKLHWSLGNEKRITECIVVGPIAQDEVKTKEFEKDFESRLELLKTIDCTKTPTEKGEFVDHAGMYKPAVKNLGKVKNGFRFTGKSFCDYFAYKIDFFDEKGPILVEIIAPDDKSRLLYSAVCEYYPIRYLNNIPNKRSAGVVATASLLTGIDTPLSKKTKKLRYLYYPGSRTAAVFIMNGFKNVAAGASKINFYRIKGDLPYSKIANNQRYIGAYTERITNTNETFGQKQGSYMRAQNMQGIATHNQWEKIYNMYADKIKFLRFSGQNLAGEGLFMYTGGHYPSKKHSYYPNNGEINQLLLGLKMYSYNDIKANIGIQYTNSYQGILSPSRVSDRRMVLGADTNYLVDRKGRQVTAMTSSGINFLHPETKAIFADCIKEIYNQFSNEKSINGMFIKTGYLSMPGFGNGRFREIDDNEVGYGDYTVALFEKETGINLNIPKTVDRFQKRYEILTTKYANEWSNWRKDKLAEALNNIQKLVPKWPLKPYIYSIHTSYSKGDFAKRLDAVSINDKKLDKKISLITKSLFYVHQYSPTSNSGFINDWNNDPKLHKFINEQKAVFQASPHSYFQEIDFPAKGDSNWIFTGTSRGVFVPRRVDEYSTLEMADILAKTEPNIFYTMWLDCNFDTNINMSQIKFLEAFRSIPQAQYNDYKNFYGANARLGKTSNGKYYLKLVNNSVYKVSGELDGKKIELKPCEMKIFNCEKNPKGYLKFSAKDETIIRNLAKDLGLNEKIDLWQLNKEIKKGINFNSMVKLDEELLNAAWKNQKMFIDDLNKNKRAMINCALTTLYNAPNGERWLPDQEFLSFKSYGNIGINYADRGVKRYIENTKIPRVYQTEAYAITGGGKYIIPIPNGDYSVKLHFAEAYAPIQSSGVRQIRIKIQGKEIPKTFDPYADAKGFAKPYVYEVKNVVVKNGRIEIEFLTPFGIQGIEVVKK